MMAGCGADRSQVVATVNGQRIRSSDVDRNLALFKLTYNHRIPDSQIGSMRQQFIEVTVDEALLLQEARRRRVQPASDVVRKELDSTVKWLTQSNYQGSEAAFRTALSTLGLNTADLREMIERKATITALHDRVTAGVRVSDAEVKAFYDANRARMRQPEAVNLREIRTQTQEEAEKALAEVKAGRPFAEVATKFTEDDAGRQAGGLTGFVPRSKLVPQLAEPAFSLPVGSVTGVIKSHYGFHVLKIEDRRAEKVLTLADVRELVRQDLLAQKRNQVFTDFVEGLKRKGRFAP